MADFLWRALAAGLGVAAVTGVLGCFVVWRRLAYFGDSLAHSALLGVALGLLYQLNLNLAVLLVSAPFALGLLWLGRRQVLAMDTLLGISAHAALSVGLVMLSLTDRPGLNLEGYLFGDILAVGTAELAWIYGGGAVLLGLLWWFWDDLVLISLNEDLAAAEGRPTGALHALLLLMLAGVVALSMQVVGILLIASLLIIPAATARVCTATPFGMVICSVGFGSLAVCLGLGASNWLDTPAAPSIVVVATVFFALIASFGGVVARSVRSARSAPTRQA